MARRVFFSFNYERDIFRVNQIRNSWVIRPGNESQQFYDKSLWENSKKNGDSAIQHLIDKGLNGASVTVVLIGAETDGRRWVDYEIKKSYQDNKGLLAIYIHNIKDNYGRTDHKGKNPFDRWYIQQATGQVYFSTLYKTYDWVYDDGYNNLSSWIEQAARNAGR
jgi:hypothetical protein